MDLDIGSASMNRTYYGAANRPHAFIGGQSPLSDNSPFITDDFLTSALFAKKEKEFHDQEEKKRLSHLSRKAGRLRELSRRMCERETVENYIQTPYSVSKGDPEFGINVFDDRVDSLRKRFTKAEKFGAVEAVGKLESAMRQSCLRVADLFAMVDHDRSGSVDRVELKAALDAMKVDLDDIHFSALFRYLDTGGDGEIEASELEEAIREHRRFAHSKKMVEAHEKKMKTRLKMEQRGPVAATDDRLSPSFRRLLSLNEPSSNSKLGGWTASSVPMAGQSLILSQVSQPLPLEKPPMTTWEMQAQKAMKESETAQSLQQAKMHKDRDLRRSAMIKKLHDRQQARKNMEYTIRSGGKCF